jgi:hypothetical protein
VETELVNLSTQGNDRPRPSRNATRRERAAIAPVLLVLLVPILLLALGPNACMLFVVGAAGGAALGASTAGPAERRSVQPGSDVGASVAVALAPARDVAAVGGVPADTTWVPGAVVLLGRVTEARGDTLRIALSEGRGSAGTATFPSSFAPTVELVRGAGVAVRVLSRVPAQTNAAAMGMLVGTIVATAAAFAAIFLVCSSQKCMD